MDHRNRAGGNRPPAYSFLSSTPWAPPASPDSSQRFPPYMYSVDTETRPLSPSRPPPQELLRQRTAPPTQNLTGSHQTAPPTAAAAYSHPSPAAPLPASRISPRIRNSSEIISEAATRTRWQETVVAEESLQRGAKEVAAKKREGRNVRERTQERLRTLLLQASPSDVECRSVLLSCAEACAAQDVDIAALLQEPILAGHLPVYWAIVKRPANLRQQRQKEDGSHHGHDDDPDAPVLAFFDFMQPLRTAAVVAARRACMAVSDNALFQRLCGRFEEFAPVTNTDEMLLGGSAAKDRDRVVIQELHSNDGAFVAHIKLVQFRLRMRLSKRICVEFITLDRMWCLTFSDNSSAGVNKSRASGASWPWLVTLQLGEHSTPTWVDAHLVITRNLPTSTKGTEKSFSIYVPLKSQGRELKPQPTSQICASLNKVVTGRDLADGLSSFVDTFDVLRMRFEAKLVKPKYSAGCVVC